MPVISCFLGIVIIMHWNDHNPPHFHVKYNEHTGIINLVQDEEGMITLEICKDNLPTRVLLLVLEWGNKYKEELMEDWELCRQTKQPKIIKPL